MRSICLFLCLLAASRAWMGNPPRVPMPRGFHREVRSVPLAALPRGSDWRYLPLQTTSSKTSRTRFALFAQTARLLFIPRRNALDWAKYLPLESTARISKSLMRSTLMNGAQQFVAASTPAAVAADSATSSVISSSSSSSSSALVSALLDWVVNLLASLKVIQRKVQQSIQTEVVAAPRALVESVSVSAQSQSSHDEAGAAWALKRLREMEMTTIMAAVEVEVVAAMTSLEVGAEEEVVTVEQMTPASATDLLLQLPLALDAGVARRSYWPAAARHLALLAHSKSSEASAEVSPKDHEMRRSYWPVRYW